MEVLLSPDEEYAQLGELAATIPYFGVRGSYRKSVPADLLWYGRVHALLERRTPSVEAIQLQLAWNRLGSTLHDGAYAEIQALIYGALARAELQLPTNARGAFIGAGNHFDALASIGRVLREAQGSLLIVDPYLNERFLTDFAAMAPEGVPMRLLGGRKGVDGTLPAAVERWVVQYGATRPIQARMAQKGALHDRVVLDEGAAWALSQSFKDFAARSPGSIIRADAELTALKREAFEEIWKGAEPI